MSEHGLLPLDPDELLTTTRAVRKRLDLERPVPLELVRECIEIATQAPSGSNQQGWHWVVVTDAEKRKALGEIYGRAFAIYRQMPFYAGNIQTGDPARDATQQRVASSAEYLAIQRASSVVPPETISPAACQVVPDVSCLRSSSTTSWAPSSARW